MARGSECPAGQRYLRLAARTIESIINDEWEAIRAAAGMVADTVRRAGLIHVFGTGHSHIMAEEMFYRAGGLAGINPILVGPLMLHESAVDSTRLERLSGLASEIFAEMKVSPHDTLIVASNSGGNPVCAGLARRFAEAGAGVIAVISRRHAAYSRRQSREESLEAIADVVIDNHGLVGDAGVEIPGLGHKVGPTSTAAGAVIVNAVVAEAVERLVVAGIGADVFMSANVEGGDQHNQALLDRYREVVRSL